MERHIPSYFEELYSRNEVEERIRELANEIAGWSGAGESCRESQVMAVCILRGSVFFFSDLLKEIPSSLQPSFCLCRSYSSDQNGVQQQNLEIQLEPQGIEGRRVLLVDDICDTGNTLQVLADLCRNAVRLRSSLQSLFTVCFLTPSTYLLLLLFDMMVRNGSLDMAWKIEILP